MDTVQERVSRGIAFLNEHARPGWTERIDLAILSVQSLGFCPASQAFAAEVRLRSCSGFGYAMEILGVEERARDYGFEASAKASAKASTISADYDALDAEWRRQLMDIRVIRTHSDPIPETVPTLHA